MFVGPNAQGKSNLLEALSLLATGKSFRAAREADLIRTGMPVARVAARVRTKAGEVSAACMITRVGEGARKRFIRNGRNVPYAQFLGGIAAVTFMPFDLQMIAGPPAIRRRFLNAALSQANRNYYRQHARYTQVVMQKNALLKSHGAIDQKLLATYNAQLADVGSQLMCARGAYIAKLGAEAARVHARWVSGQAQLEIAYAPSPALPGGDTSPGAVLQALEHALVAHSAAEQARKTSLVGPHRDDITFSLGSQPLARFGSQGQQRTAVLAVKSAEYTLLAAAAGEPPLLLLDDVLSELDASRSRAFMTSIQDCEQAFVTSTHVLEGADSAARIYQIHGGQLHVSSAGAAR